MVDSSRSAPAEEGPAAVDGPDIESDDIDDAPGARLLFRAPAWEEDSAFGGVSDIVE